MFMYDQYIMSEIERPSTIKDIPNFGGGLVVLDTFANKELLIRPN
jgi:hypothetical protein